MNKMERLAKQDFFTICKKHGFTKKYNNLYRCHGQGLLEVISYFGNGTAVPQSPRNVEVTLGVFSLYSELNWIPTHIANIVRYHLPATHEVTSSLFFSNSIAIPASETQIMLDTGLTFLDHLISHAQLISFLEKYDLEFGSQIIKNDIKKIAPYILSNQLEQAAEIIDVIEMQNWEAHLVNSQQLSGYDVESNKNMIVERLSPLLLLRDAIQDNDSAIIEKYLLTNYRKNTVQLKKLGIPIDESCVAFTHT